jgi:hypothetical protein
MPSDDAGEPVGLKRRQRIAQKRCPEKIGHKTIVGAREHLASLQAKGADGADRLRCYLCRLCLKFHVGHARKGLR